VGATVQLTTNIKSWQFRQVYSILIVSRALIFCWLLPFSSYNTQYPGFRGFLVSDKLPLTQASSQGTKDQNVIENTFKIIKTQSNVIKFSISIWYMKILITLVVLASRDIV
jgi:hypothetical protein